MIRFDKTLNAWGTPGFETILKQEIEQLDPQALPLQQGLSRGNYVSDNGFSAMILGVTEQPGSIRARAGIFYAGIIAGCSCADDPTPVDEHSEYCELQFDIDKATADTTVTLLPQ
ncbi:MAG: hypothetical protein J5I92_04115 [Thiogranum sp.]|nr:hypothetical protein [Thiogranum sp.]